MFVDFKKIRNVVLESFLTVKGIEWVVEVHQRFVRGRHDLGINGFQYISTYNPTGFSFSNTENIVQRI